MMKKEPSPDAGKEAAGKKFHIPYAIEWKFDSGYGWHDISTSKCREQGRMFAAGF
jgi:hypothetical protein